MARKNSGTQSRAKSDQTADRRGRRKSKLKLELEEMNKLVSEYPTKPGTAIYLYRLFPQIDRSFTGHRFSYIEKLEYGPPPGSPPDTPPDDYPPDFAGYLTKKWGGGAYKVAFCDSNNEKDDQRIAECIVKISHIEHDPILEARELVRGPQENEQWLQYAMARGRIQIDDETGGITPVLPGTGAEEGKTTKAALEFAERVINRQAQATPGADAATKASLDVMTDTTKRLVGFTLDQAKGPDLEGFLKIAKELSKGNDGGGASAAMLTAVMNQNTMLLTKLLDRADPKPERNGIDQAVNLLDKLAGAAQRFGINLPNKASGLSGALDSLIEQAPKLLGLYLAVKGAGPGAGLAGLTPSTPPAIVTSAAASAEAGQPAAATATTNPQAAILYQWGVKALSCLERGYQGDQLAEAVVTLNSMMTYQGVKAIGAEGIKAILQSFPDLWPKFAAAETQLDKFLTEFLTAFDEEETPDAAGQPATAPAAA